MTNLRSVSLLAVGALLLVGSACGGSDTGESSEAAPAGSAIESDDVSDESQDSTGPDATMSTSGSEICDDAVADANAAVDELLDSADSGTQPDSDQVEEIFTQMGEGIGQNCADIAAAVSEFIVHASDERSTRSEMANAVIDGMLPGLCGLDYELSPSAQLACTPS